jgi:hypothetical protein
MRYKGGVISATPPTVTPPVDGEGGSASGIWSLKIQGQYEGTGEWPKLTLPRELYGSGQNFYGQLGQNDTIGRSSPTQVGTEVYWAGVTAGYFSSLATTTTNAFFYTGRGGLYSPLNDTVDRSSPVQVGALTNWNKFSSGRSNQTAIKTDGTLIHEKNILPIRSTPLRFYGTGGDIITATPGDAHHSYFGFVGYARGYVKSVG